MNHCSKIKYLFDVFKIVDLVCYVIFGVKKKCSDVWQGKIWVVTAQMLNTDKRSNICEFIKELKVTGFIKKC